MAAFVHCLVYLGVVRFYSSACVHVSIRTTSLSVQVHVSVIAFLLTVFSFCIMYLRALLFYSFVICLRARFIGSAFLFLRLAFHVPVSVTGFFHSAFYFCFMYLDVLLFCVSFFCFLFLHQSCRRHAILVSMLQDPRAQKRLHA